MSRAVPHLVVALYPPFTCLAARDFFPVIFPENMIIVSPMAAHETIQILFVRTRPKAEKVFGFPWGIPFRVHLFPGAARRITTAKQVPIQIL